MNKVRAEKIDDMIETINDLADTLKAIQVEEQDEFNSMPESLRKAAYLKSSESAGHMDYALYNLSIVIKSLDKAKEKE